MNMTCYYCNQDFPKDQMKHCARCRLVTYCSKECQTYSWKASHKHSCRIHPSLVDPNDPTKILKNGDPKKYSHEWMDLETDKSLSRWLQLWRSNFQTWTAIALNLPNHPPNRVVTHCMQLIIQPNDYQDDPAKQYTVVDGSVLRFAEVRASHPELGAVIDPTDFTRIRFVVILQNSNGDPPRLRLFQWNDLNIAKWRDMPKSRGAEMHAGWFHALRFSVDSMSPEDVEKAFGKQSQRSSSSC